MIEIRGKKIKMNIWIIAVILNTLLMLNCGSTSEKENQSKENANVEDKKEIPSPELLQKQEKFCNSVKEGDIVMIQRLIKEDINVNFTCKNPLRDCNSDEEYSRSPLEIASMKNKMEIVKILIEAKADINFPNNCFFGSTPLFSSVGHYDMTKYLIDNGAKVNIKAIFGLTPLHVAETEKVVRLLVDNGGDIDATTHLNDGILAIYSGKTPMHIMFEGGRAETGAIKYLIDKGADINALDSMGYSPLHYASGSGKIEKVKLLIEAGAEKNIKSNDGVTALDIAIKKGHKDIIKYLKKVGAK